MTNHARMYSRREFLRRSGITFAGLATAPTLLASCTGGETEMTQQATETTFLGASTTRTPELAQLEMVLSWLPNVQWAGNWIAEERGYYAQNGVSMDHRAGGPNTPAPVELVAGGEVDFGVQGNMQGLMDAINAGNDFVTFGTQFQVNPAGILSLADNPVRSAEDLVGKRVLGPNPVDERSVRAVLEINGLEPEFDFIPSGFSPEPLLAGQGDAMVVFVTNQPIILEHQEGMVANEDYIAVTYDELGLPRYSTLYFGERRWVEDNHDDLVGMMRAVVRGWEDNANDASYGARLAVETYGSELGLELNEQIRQNELQIELMHSAATEEHGLFWIDLELFGGPMYEALRLTGLDDLPDPETVVDLSILQEVHA